ncbi:rhomboid family intramembrane serine protease [Flavimarina sp. Hel_I_48]|uniref:rhomboid family intramembrane serine protease n=1 Tax=Flavimarina sp. Hel_I_48 TaxID=1392488 RepID=UPI0004DF9997|nr:rhomboid family intramembrane serine protease [Flavimarina sp. Hel_I_48]
MKSHSETNHFKFSLTVLAYPLALVFVMLIVFWYELRFHENFTPHGIMPRTFSGLQGILFSPFIHATLQHLYNNSIPFIVLTGGLFYFYRAVAGKVFVLLFLFSGIGTWIIGRESYHIGASGIVYGLAAFLFFKGIWSGYYRLIAFSLIVIFLYGSLVWGTMPLDPGMSWEGHLSGFASGLFLAYFIRQKIPKPVKYEWENPDFNAENDDFLRHFDKDGNFIEFLPEEEEDTIEDVTSRVEEENINDLK